MVSGHALALLAVHDHEELSGLVGLGDAGGMDAHLHDPGGQDLLAGNLVHLIPFQRGLGHLQGRGMV